MFRPLWTRSRVKLLAGSKKSFREAREAADMPVSLEFPGDVRGRFSLTTHSGLLDPFDEDDPVVQYVLIRSVLTFGMGQNGQNPVVPRSSHYKNGGEE